MNFNTTLIYRVKILQSTLLIFFTYLILQMSYTLVSHNFGLSLMNYGYVNIIFLTFTYIVLVLQIKIITNLKWLYNKLYVITAPSRNKNIVLTNNILNLNLLVYIFIFLTSYIYLISFNPILNNVF